MKVGRLIFQFGVMMLLVCITLAPGVSWGAFDAFMKIDGIDGESTDDRHYNWVEVLHVSGGERNGASGSASTAGGATANRPEFSDFTIVKALDKSSPKLNQACANGTHIKEVIIELCRAGGDKVKYMEYKLGNCTVSSVKVEGSSGGAETLPLETVTFNYGSIQWTYTQPKRSDGSGGGQTAAGWDLEKNKPI